MKTILSRKGFDSSYGKGYSPILPNGEMLSMPIPAAKNETGIPLNELRFGGKTYQHYADQLYPTLDKRQLYHFDPDLNHSSLANRNPKWKGAFGQAYGAQTHLFNEGVSQGDVFLFFGSFKQTYFDNGVLKWEPQHPFHAIFGYLEVGHILSQADIAQKTGVDIYGRHPHFENAALYDNLNSIYVASDRLRGTALKGSGTFVYNDSLRLTKAGFNKSIWELPGFFSDKSVSISRHKERSRFRKSADKLLLSTVGIGQDFVVDDPRGRVEEWAMGTVKSSASFEL